MSNSEDKLNEFAHKYNAIVKPSGRSYRRAQLPGFGTWNASDPVIYDTMMYSEIPCVDIHMPEDRFRALLEHDEWLHRRYAGRHYTSGPHVQVTDLVVEHERECRVRHENPAVKKAYENYQLLLRMVENNY